MSCILEDRLSELGQVDLINPYWEKWGPGRPSKEAKLKRELATQWNLDNVLKHGLVKSLVSESMGDMIKSNKPRIVSIKYIQRINEPKKNLI